ncbi:hypothetical protein UPYG_G00209990 [Umbra pygmaea]|uniref:RRM domain-containing protein n=1 Tax=Umbra pygmaea TaxID=75934 RepID=A0ABD0X1M9_UMBPY
MESTAKKPYIAPLTPHLFTGNFLHRDSVHFPSSSTMSHNYPYRPPPAAKDLRASSGSFNRSDNLHSGDRHSLYGSSLETTSHSTLSPYPSSSSQASVDTKSTYSSIGQSDQTLTLLTSCGLEPKDLSLLAGMPEHLITVDNLPRLLLGIRKKKETQQSSYPDTRPTTSYTLDIPSFPSSNPSLGRVWEQNKQSHSQPKDYPPEPCRSFPPIKYPLDPHPSTPPSQPLLRDQGPLDRHGKPMQVTRSCVEPVPVRVVEYNYGKESPSSYLSPSSNFSTALGGGSSSSHKRPISTQPADYRYPLPPATDYRFQDQDVSIVKSKMTHSDKAPTKEAALDFHGEIPRVFPYTCSLCDITVLSEKYWSSHINGTQHADGQLTLLQMYPKWDCRMQSSRKGDEQSERQIFEEKKDGASNRAINYLGKPRKNIDNSPNANATKVTKGSGKVVCAKFPAQALNEDGLLNLIKPFGEVVKVIMFPALAFVEMNSTDQAQGLVKYFLRKPARVVGGQVEFSISSTFNFLQSSKVLRFNPVPTEKLSAAWEAELLAVAKCFGSVEHTLFLPTQAFVEMTNTMDARKLFEHHTSKPLKINGIHIKVDFSSEYNSLRNVSQKKSSDQLSPVRSRRSEDRSKRKRSHSPRRSFSPKRDPSKSPKRWRRTPERESNSHKERAKSNDRAKSRSRSPTEHRDRLYFRSPSHHSKKGDASEKTTVKPVPKNTPHTSTCSLPLTKDGTLPHSNFMENTQKGVDDTTQSKQEPEDGGFQTCDTDSEIDGMEVIGEEEDIEGMAVYGEDGEENSDMEEEDEHEETDEQEEKLEGKTQDLIQDLKALERPEQKATSPSKAVDLSATVSEQRSEKECEGQKGDASFCGDDEEEPDFPEDLENLITLDELEDQSSNDDHDNQSTEKSKNETSRSDHPSERVIYIKNLPRGFYSDADFVNIVRGYGRVHRYFLLRHRNEGFIEMKRSYEADKAIRGLRFNGCKFHGQWLSILLSRKYKRLTTGLKPESDSESNNDRKKEHSRSSRRSERTSSHSKSTKDDQAKDVDEKNDKDDNTTASDNKPQRDDEKMDNGGKTATEEEKDDKAKDSPEKTREKTMLCLEEHSRSSAEEGKVSEVKTDSRLVPIADEEKQACSTKAKMEERPENNVETNTGDGVKQEPDSMTGIGLSYQPNNPVGREFIKPVVGFFCHLCKLIYADEDEAKNEHCSSFSHYQKFLEHSGKDMA